MNLRVETKGILRKKMLENTTIQLMLMFSMLMYFCIIAIVMIYVKSLALFMFIWYFFAIGLSKKDINSVFDYIISAPFVFFLDISYNIFAFFMKRKYPNIPEDKYERYMKIKKLLKIKKNR